MDKALFNPIINKMGVTFEIMKNGSVSSSFKGILQPLRYKNKIYLEGVPTELGYDNLKKYLLLSPPEFDLSTLDNINTYLCFDGNHYSIDHTEKVLFLGKPAYTWSIISKEE